MTPLEIAREKIKHKSCKNCEKSEQINNVLYCTISGKIIHPMAVNTQVCNSGRLKED